MIDFGIDRQFVSGKELNYIRMLLPMNALAVMANTQSCVLNG